MWLRPTYASKELDGCGVSSSVEVTQDDIDNLLLYEERRRISDNEHKQWLAKTFPGRCL